MSSSALTKSERSTVIDVTYQQLYSILLGHAESSTPKQLIATLQPRVPQLANISQLFGRPKEESRKRLQSQTITLPDDTVLTLTPSDKLVAQALSDRLQIDEVQALILFRSFIYNVGLPGKKDEGTTDQTPSHQDIVAKIEPFYYTERLFLLRVFLPLLRASQNEVDPNKEVAQEILPLIVPDGVKFVETLLEEYTRKRQEEPPVVVRSNPVAVAQWSLQNLKEQLVLLEVIFWSMWGYVPCDGPLLVKIYENAYASGLGKNQKNAMYMLDNESGQLLQDSAAVWMLILIEVLELEKMAEQDGFEISARPLNPDFYVSSPESLQRIHELVTTHGDSQYACIYLAWTYVVYRLTAVASELKEIPEAYRSFFASLDAHSHSYSRGHQNAHELMIAACLSPAVGLFNLMLLLLTNSPLFVTSVAWRTGSSVTDPNAIAFRSVFKGLVISLVELVPVEMIPDFDTFVEVWIALFGRSESSSVSSICAQFWKIDLRVGNARKAILDVARSRFPIQIRPLVRILRAMTGTGFLDTDPLSAADQILDRDTDFEERDLCSRYVFYYMNKLPTFSQVVHSSSCAGSHALYEKHTERTIASVAGIGFTNSRSLRLPGGSILPAKSIGRLLSSDGGDLLVVSWAHDHSGWGLLLEVLRHHVQRKGLSLTSEVTYPNVALVGKGTDRPVNLSLADIGIELNDSEDEQLVTDILDLIRCVIKENEIIAESMLETMEQSAATTESPDLIQMTTIILEDALVRAAKRLRSAESFSPLITSAISVLGALLALPKYSNRVWLYVRSTTALFGAEGTIANSSAALASERVRGEYDMTLVILQFAHQLLDEAIASLTTVVPLNPRLQQVKEEILLRISRFIHTELWIEYNAWKYTQLGDRFEIGRRISTFYYRILVLCPTPDDSAPFAALCQAVREAFLYKASNLTTSPLVSTITSMSPTLEALYTSRRYGDARKLISVTESHLRFARTLLNGKRIWTPNATECLLEQAFCARTFGANATTLASKRPSADPIDDIAGLIKKRDLGTTIPAEAIRLLHALSALISTQPSPPSIIGHLVDAEATIASLVRIAQHPYDDLSLRCAIWNFMALAVDTEPALAGILVTGTYRGPASAKDKEKSQEKAKGSEAKQSAVESAFDVARKTLGNWNALWESNPQLLAGAMHFLEVIFQHGLEHAGVLQSIRKDGSFWTDIAAIYAKELDPAPEYKANGRTAVDGVLQSNLHEVVTIHSYRTLVKSHALQIIGLDVENFMRSASTDKAGLPRPLSLDKIKTTFTDSTRFRRLTSEASANSYDPELYDELVSRLKANVGAISLDQLQHLRLLPEREYGDEYAFSVDKLRVFLKRHQNAEDAMREDQAGIEDLLISVNLNLSLAHGQSSLRKSWQHLLKHVVAYLRDDNKARSVTLSIASSLAAEFAKETRSGDMMASIWSEELSLLLALVEVSWFSTNSTPDDVKSLVSLSSSIRSIILSSALPPLSSLMGNYAYAFHGALLQVMYFCIRECRNLFTRTKSIRAEDRLTITALFEASQNLTIKALRFAFDSARARYDTNLDADMGLLVAVLDQATRLDVVPSPSHWLSRCQEEDLIRASLELFARTDLAGLSDLSALVTQKRPLYAQHILTFHMSLASIPTAAERLANEGLLTAYGNNALSAAINAGSLETTLPELPTHRSPAQTNYCIMLSVVTTVSLALGRRNHFFDVELCSFVQSCGDQIHRTLSWTIDQPVTFPLLDEMDRTVNLFYAIAENCPTTSKDPSVERVLHVFSAHAALLLQQLNYALTHPNQLARSFDPITAQDRLLVEQEQKDTSMSASVSYDPARRPLLTSLIYRFYKLSSVVLHTLNLVSCGFTVLTEQVESWPAHEALIIPHSKVVLGERASLGTLLELGNATLDILRVLVNQPAGRAIPSASGPLALDVRTSAETLRGNLEAILFYSATQLVMWITKPEDDSAYKDAENDDYLELGESTYRMVEDSGPRSRQPRTALADRVRRGMRGEIVEDLQGLLNRAKPIIAKSDSLLGNKTPDISQTLSDFLRERASLML